MHYHWNKALIKQAVQLFPPCKLFILKTSIVYICIHGNVIWVMYAHLLKMSDVSGHNRLAKTTKQAKSI